MYTYMLYVYYIYVCQQPEQQLLHKYKNQIHTFNIIYQSIVYNVLYVLITLYPVYTFEKETYELTTDSS